MLHPGGAELRGELRRAEERAERHDGRARATGAERDHRPRGAVGHQHADACALAHADIGEVRGERGTATLELTVGQRVVVGDDDVSGGLLVGPAADQPRHGETFTAHVKSSSIAARSGLPLDSIGRSVGASTRKRRGTLYADSRVRSSARSASRSGAVSGSARITAATTWSRSGSGTPSTITARPPVASLSAASTSSGETFAPAVLIIEPRRPWK